MVIVPILGFVAIGAVVLAVLSILAMPKSNPGEQRGVGANGFRAYEEKGTTLGMNDTVSKDDVVWALGKKAKSVGDPQTSNVFNLDGNRGQTLTFDLVRADGGKASLYVDLMLFKNVHEFNQAKVLASTVKEAGKIGGHPGYYMVAQTLGSDREYRLMVVNGLKVYKFVLVQPYRSITINEVGALASLKKLAGKADLK